mgnify:CR=1 FL=1
MLRFACLTISTPSRLTSKPTADGRPAGQTPFVDAVDSAHHRFDLSQRRNTIGFPCFSSPGLYSVQRTSSRSSQWILILSCWPACSSPSRLYFTSYSRASRSGLSAYSRHARRDVVAHAATTATTLLMRFWTKIFAVSFAMGVVSGIVLSYQFGTNWSRFSVATGNVIGPLIGYEVLTAFFLEATFLGVLLFGFNRVPPWLYVIVSRGRRDRHCHLRILDFVGQQLDADADRP